MSKKKNVVTTQVLTYRDLDYIKPPKFRDYLTLTELSRKVHKDPSWLKKLERGGRIPKASRVQMGEISVRLWSPAQVDEVEAILSTLKPGRPPGT
jgi:hypothetical protein